MSFDRQAYREANREHIRAKNKAWREANPDKCRCSDLRKNYGITLEEYNQRLAEQDYSCKICNTTEPGHRGTFHVDHNHITGAIRGLLCHRCNTGIGLLQDSPTLLLSAHRYLLSEGHYGTS